MNIFKEKLVDRKIDVDLDEYFDFINQNKLPEKTKFKTSFHHILPRWAFPEFANLKTHSWNGAHLTYENHLKAHILLAKCWPVFQNTITVLRMTDNRINIKNLNDQYFLEYSKILEKNSQLISENNKGKKWSDERRYKHSENLKNQHLAYKLKNEKRLSEYGLAQSKLKNSINQKEKVKNGTHHFLKNPDGNSIGGDIAKEGRLRWQKDKEFAKRCSKESNRKRVEDGTHNFLDKAEQKKRSLKRVEDGTHNFLGKNIVTLVDKDGNGKRLPIETLNYWKTSGLPMTEWDYVSIASKEAKRRRALFNINKPSEI